MRKFSCFLVVLLFSAVLGVTQQNQESSQPTQPQATPQQKTSKKKEKPQAPAPQEKQPSQAAPETQQPTAPPTTETKTPPEEKTKEGPQPGIEPNLKDEPPVVTQHEIHIDGKVLKYTATVGRMPLKDTTGKIVADMFYVAYTVPGTAANERPLTFSYNGGPGSSSIWLHMGALGPRRVVMQPEGWMPASPYRLVDNEDTILDKTDLVMVDAIATGFSRAVDEKTLKHYLGVKGDIEAFGDFIRMYITRNERWSSPLYLLGESYGTTRSAGLSGYLIDKGIAFNGIYLLSTAIDFSALETPHGNDLAYIVILPSYAMAAAYHHKIAPELAANPEKLRTDVENWAWSSYAVALAKGDSISPQEREAVIDQMSRYIGIPKEVIDQANLRLDVPKFTHYLLLDQKLRIGRLDDRFTGPDPDEVLDTPFYDPSEAAPTPPFTMMFNNYLRSELNYKTDMPYYTMAGGDFWKMWDWGKAIEGLPSTSMSLREAMTQDPYLKIMVGEGYYDLATPYFAATYSIDHLNLPVNLRKNISIVQYNSGHMVYLRQSEHDKFKKDVDKFIESTETAGQGMAQ
jgi:carboxypeptidase C (cathepsin A)